MAQFDLFERRRSKAYPFVVDVQADLLRDLATRVVVPLSPRERIAKPVTRLNPVVELEGGEYVLLFQELAAMPARELGEPVGDLSAFRPELIAALDLLFTGI